MKIAPSVLPQIVLITHFNDRYMIAFCQPLSDRDRFSNPNGRNLTPNRRGLSAGLCLCYSNFRFRRPETGSRMGRDRFEAYARWPM